MMLAFSKILIKRNTLVVAMFVCVCILGSASTAFAAATAPWESAYSAPAFAGGAIREVFCDIVGMVQGSFGALLLSTAALMAVAGAAFGDMTSAKSGLVVGVGAATIAAGVSLYFGDLGCGLDGGAQPGNNAAPVLRQLDADDAEGIF
jgi:hypothetical protein